MKHFYFFLIVSAFCFTLHSQIIDIPDANFKVALIANGVDTNSDGEIQISEAEATFGLFIANQPITSMVGIEYFVNLDVLECNDLQLVSLDISNLHLSEFYCTNNPNLITLELGSGYDYLTINNTGLTEIDFIGTFVQYLYVSNNANLTYVQLGYLDYYNYHSYSVTDNPILEFISFKNGVTQYSGYDYDSGTYTICNNPSLIYVCADESEMYGYTYINAAMEEIYVEGVQDYVNNCGYTNVTVSSYCPFLPSGEYYSIEGNARIDSDFNGCDSSDPIFPNLNFAISNIIQIGNFITNSSGNYSLLFPEGSHTITPELENPTYFTVSPTSLTVDFPTDPSPYTQDFCVTANGIYHDLEVTILPLEAARPGFDSNYKVVYKNKGTSTLSGTIQIGFQDDIMDFVSATPPNESGVLDLLSWSYTDLLPFEVREIDFTMNINSPMENPPVNGGDILTFIASINHPETDETPDDNLFTLTQTVVNSFDPNDKTCLQGDVISPEMVGEYVHYMIRFENTGTANAVNIAIKDAIDTSKLDLSTLIPLRASHDFFARIENNAGDQYVEFIFEDINLPFDDANNDGFVIFKIRTLDTLQVGDTFENNAEIYFDFNYPIITNTTQTSVQTLSIAEQSLDVAIMVYPNPSSDVVNIETTYPIEAITLYDATVRVVKEIKLLGSKNTFVLNTKNLAKGNYFIKVDSNSKSSVKKLLVL